VHLAEWPNVEKINTQIVEDMKKVREIVTLGLEARQKAGIKVRQPLGSLKVKNLSLKKEFIELIKDEINVKEIIYDKNIDTEVSLDTNITEGLKQEGDYRELVRAMQDMRKNLGLTPSDVVSVVFETDEKGKKLIQKFEADIKKTVLVSEMKFGENDGIEVKVDELVFKIKIGK
jgi:isoleucyl-tRNA synthetase